MTVSPIVKGICRVEECPFTRELHCGLDDHGAGCGLIGAPLDGGQSSLGKLLPFRAVIACLT